MEGSIRFKDLSDASIKSFQFGYKKYDCQIEREEKMVVRLFKDLLSGKINLLYRDNGSTLKIYHRSPKKALSVQLSVADIRDGGFIPIRDSQFICARDMFEEGVDPGVWMMR